MNQTSIAALTAGLLALAPQAQAQDRFHLWYASECTEKRLRQETYIGDGRQFSSRRFETCAELSRLIDYKQLPTQEARNTHNTLLGRRPQIGGQAKFIRSPEEFLTERCASHIRAKNEHANSLVRRGAQPNEYTVFDYLGVDHANCLRLVDLVDSDNEEVRAVQEEFAPRAHAYRNRLYSANSMPKLNE